LIASSELFTNLLTGAAVKSRPLQLSMTVNSCVLKMNSGGVGLFVDRRADADVAGWKFSPFR
jgi:hypothetical protein